MAYEGSAEFFYDLVNKIIDDTQVDYYDYSMDERFSSRHDWFMNGVYLNREGAKTFTDILSEEALSNKTSY